MKYIHAIILSAFLSHGLLAQSTTSTSNLTLLKQVGYTPVKNQANTGTCWSFSTTSLIESQALRGGIGEFDLSEMFTVRNIYTEKARNYVLRQGAAQFGPGGLGHDVIHAIDQYGAVPESVYSGMLLGAKFHDHSEMDARLKQYLDSLLQRRPIPGDWMKGFQAILDDHLGRPPEKFMFREKLYTPQTFAKEVLHFDARDYVMITSFTHHPFYEPFILEIPDNFNNGAYYNLPIGDVIRLAARAIEQGYSLMWDADVSNRDFRQKEGYAMLWKSPPQNGDPVDPDVPEEAFDQSSRQSLFENLTTQDDHLMHLVGLERSAAGKRFFLVKNSWGEVGPFKGFIHVSEAYFAINTISIVLPRAVLDQDTRERLHLGD